LKVVVRRARASDRAPLMKFVRNVWGGHDYIPSIWEEWLADRRAILDVVEVDGKPVGMGRLRFLDDGVGWLEGARVHPDYRGRGLAGQIGRDLIRTGREKGVTSFRLTSGSRNKSAHRQVAKLGFSEVARVSVYEPSEGARFDPQTKVWQAAENETDEVFNMVVGSQEYRLGGGVFWDGFSATELSLGILTNLVDRGSVLRCDEAVAISKLGGEGGSPWRQVCFIAGSPEGAVRLVKHALGKKEAVRTRWRLAFIPQGSRLIRELRNMGMRRSSSLILFESADSKD